MPALSFRLVPPVLVFVLISAVSGQKGDTPGVWNQWRGPTRDGLAPSAPAWPESFEKALKRAWVVDLDPSYSGPVCDAERVYTTSTVDKEREVAYAFDRRTGEKLWETSWKGAMKVPFFAARNGSWIRSTPALANGRLFVAGMRDVLVCLDAATGEEVWRFDFPRQTESELPAFGFVSSPLVHGDGVYVQAGGAFVRLDSETGKPVWHSLGDGGGMHGSAFASPYFAAGLAGRDQMLVQTRAELAGVAPDDGSVLWRQPIRSERGMAILTPTVFGGGVFTSAYGGRGQFFRPRQATAEDETETPWVAREEWMSRAQAYMTSPVLVDGHAYLYLRSKRMTCVDLASGKIRWTSGPQGDEYWSLVAQGDRILALTNDGDLLVIAADPEEFRMLERVSVSPSETWAHLAVDGEWLFVREQDGLSAWRFGGAQKASDSRASGG